jgi:GTP-binding protein
MRPHRPCCGLSRCAPVDRLLVVEVGLQDPLLGLLAAHVPQRLEAALLARASHEGMSLLGYAMGELVEQGREAEAPDETAPAVLRLLVVEVGLQDPLLGLLAAHVPQRLEAALLARDKARPGDAVLIGPEEDGVVFDWEPTMVGGAELLAARSTRRPGAPIRARRARRSWRPSDRRTPGASARAPSSASRTSCSARRPDPATPC